MATLSTFDPVGAFQGARRNALSLESAQDTLSENRANRPLRNELAQLKVGEAQKTAQRGDVEFNQEQALQKATILNQSSRALLGLPLEQRAAAFATLAPELQKFGIDPAAFAGSQFTDEELNSAIAGTQGFISKPDTLTSAQKEFASLSVNLSEAEKEKARRIDLGLDPRAVGSAGQTISVQGTADKVAAVESTLAGGKEEGKLIKQLKLKPKVEAAVVTAVAEAKAAVDAIGTAKSNNATLNLYDTAMSALVTSLGGTVTGPVAGWLPAVTANAQIAEGAIAAIAPVLKQLFRSAGEGIFTDKDQELLLKMIPTRKTSPAARQSILENIDAIVRAKLGQPASSGGKGGITPEESGRGGQVMTDANGNTAIVFPDGTFREVQ